jgi:hypothetical protein
MRIFVAIFTRIAAKGREINLKNGLILFTVPWEQYFEPTGSKLGQSD